MVKHGSGSMFSKVAEASELLGISPPTVRELVRTGELAGVRLGGLILVRRSALDALARESEDPHAAWPIRQSATDSDAAEGGAQMISSELTPDDDQGAPAS